MKFYIYSLGCPKNLVDSERFAFIAENEDFELCDKEEDADIILVNTCGFIKDAKEESVNTILDALSFKEQNPNLKVIVTGCLSERYYDDLLLEIPEIDNLLHLKDFPKFREIVSSKENLMGRKLLTPNHYAYLRISDGCNNNCSYCAIPAIRGKLLSDDFDELIKEAENLAERGVKELIITAQDITQFYLDKEGKSMLVDLLRELEKIDSIEWIRLLYMHPAHITEELIDFVAQHDKICNYFDIPLQHINNDILKSMNRRITHEDIDNLFDMITQKIPEAVIRTTFIVGYPGESYYKFKELKQFIQKTKIGRVGIFTYSEEENTRAAGLEKKVSMVTSIKRKDELMSIQQDISIDFLSNFVDKTISVIIDSLSEEDGFKFEGRSYFDAPDIDGNVYITEGKAEIGQIVQVKIFDSWEYDLIGKIVD